MAPLELSTLVFRNPLAKQAVGQTQIAFDLTKGLVALERDINRHLAKFGDKGVPLMIGHG